MLIDFVLQNYPLLSMYFQQNTPFNILDLQGESTCFFTTTGLVTNCQRLATVTSAFPNTLTDTMEPNYPKQYIDLELYIQCKI